MDIVINFMRPGKGMPQYIEALVDDKCWDFFSIVFIVKHAHPTIHVSEPNNKVIQL